METEKILKADLLDIVFENRNKAYGAYALRRNYDHTLYKALGAAFLFAATLSLLSFMHKEKKHSDLVDTAPYIIAKANEPKKEEKKPEKPKEAPQPKKAALPKPPVPSQVFTVPVVTKSPVTTNIHSLDSTAISNVTVKIPPGSPAPPVVPVTPEPPGGGGGTASAPTIVDHVTPTNFAEVMPSFPGGPDALRKFLVKNLVNPDQMENGGEVSVKIRFVVGYDGKLKSFETVEDGGTVFNEEVIRVLKKMPQWIPGKTKGENVSVYYTLPVKFTPAE